MKLYAELTLMVPLNDADEAVTILKKALRDARLECKAPAKKQRKKSNGARWKKDDKIEFNGQKMTMTAWAEQQGMSEDSLRWRLNSGWTIGEALTRPTRG